MRNSIKTSHRRKLNFVIGFAVIAVFIIYQLSIKKTVQAHNESKRIETQLESVEHAAEVIEKLKYELNAQDQLLGSNNNAVIDHRAFIITELTNYCQNRPLDIYLIKEPVIQNEDNFRIEFTEVVLEGSFKYLLKFIHEFETNSRIGKVVSTSFTKELNKRSDIEKLFLNIIVQNITVKKSNDEKYK